MSPQVSPALFDRIAPALFVLIWSTGWISARYAAEDADPLTFLSLRYAFAGAALTAFALAAGASWPRTARAWGHALVSGVLLHAIYLGGVWWAIRHGLPASISGLLAAIQPILTAILAPRLIGEPITARQWAGVLIGLGGLAAVLAPKLAGLEASAVAAALGPLAINAVAMISATLGAFYQKRYLASGDLRTMTVAQYLGALLATLPVAVLVEPMRIVWTPTIVATMAWSVLALSIGAISLLLLLIRHGAVARSAALIYLVPPTVAVEAFLLFGERLAPVQIAGATLAVLGVALATPRRV